MSISRWIFLCHRCGFGKTRQKRKTTESRTSDRHRAQPTTWCLQRICGQHMHKNIWQQLYGSLNVWVSISRHWKPTQKWQYKSRSSRLRQHPDQIQTGSSLTARSHVANNQLSIIRACRIMQLCDFSHTPGKLGNFVNFCYNRCIISHFSSQCLITE